MRANHPFPQAETMTTFYKNFIRLCHDRGIKPGPACDGIGVGRAAASKWARGVVPKDATLLKVADFFGISAEFLLEDHGEPEFYATKAEREIIVKFRELSDREKQIVRFILGVKS